MKVLLDEKVDSALVDALLTKIDEYKAKVDQSYQDKLTQLKESFDVSTEKLFAYADNLIDEAKQETKKEYSAILASKLDDKNSKIEELQEEIESYKEELSEKVDTFLNNSREDIRTIVEEEIKTDSETLKAQHLIEQVRDLVGSETTKIVSVEEGKVDMLERDIAALKERVDQKTKLTESLKAELRKRELLESVPEADREFFVKSLEGTSTINEVEEGYRKTKAAVRHARADSLLEEYEEFDSKGIDVLDESDIFEEELPRGNSFISDRMLRLAK